MRTLIYLETPLFVISLLAFSRTVSAGTGITVPGLYNSGVNDFGQVLAHQSLEQHYSVSGAATIAYVVPPVYEPNLGWAWAAAPAGSAWIGPNATTNTASPDPVGNYVYELEFDLTGIDPQQIEISGGWMTDNSGSLYLNGIPTGFATAGESYKQLSAFNLTSGFVTGINTLEFHVFNELGAPNPSGLCVANLTAIAVPEPSFVAMLGGGLLLALARRPIAESVTSRLRLW